MHIGGRRVEAGIEAQDVLAFGSSLADLTFVVELHIVAFEALDIVEGFG